MNSDLPYFDELTRIVFPAVEDSSPEGIVAVGGNLSPGMLLSAYRQGIFPWYSDPEPILWWSPDPRCVIFPKDIHISRSMRKFLKKNIFMITLDTDFEAIINGCKEAPRPGQRGTWITDAMRDAYIKLHNLGYAHSVEVWDGKILAGGLYGVSLGSCFFGESMFSRVSNASKVALIWVSELIATMGFEMFDCQVYSPHVETMGARLIPRNEFIIRLERCLEHRTLKGNWSKILSSSKSHGL
jgi:leucyl/phenylalanyl-tRNA--protein transferase